MEKSPFWRFAELYFVEINLILNGTVQNFLFKMFGVPWTVTWEKHFLTDQFNWQVASMLYWTFTFPSVILLQALDEWLTHFKWKWTEECR